MGKKNVNTVTNPCFPSTHSLLAALSTGVTSGETVPVDEAPEELSCGAEQTKTWIIFKSSQGLCKTSLPLPSHQHGSMAAERRITSSLGKSKFIVFLEVSV